MSQNGEEVPPGVGEEGQGAEQHTVEPVVGEEEQPAGAPAAEEGLPHADTERAPASDVQSGPEALAAAARARAAALAAQFSSQAAGGAFPVGSGHDHHRSEDGDEHGKRKFDAEGGDEPGAKRTAYDSGYGDQPLPGPPSIPAATLAAAAGMFGAMASETMMCPGDKVGKIIGRAGATIKELQDRTNTRIQVDHKAPSNDKPVTISGSREDVDRCRQLITELLEGSDAGLSSTTGAGLGPPGVGDGEPRMLECPQGIVGRIIGRGGETIRSLQQASGAHILINQDFPDGMPRQVIISGKPDAIERGYRMVQELISGDPGSATQVVQKYGLGQTEYMECPKPMVGRVIGKNGETIKGLQKQFNVSIQIDQGATPCKITITGNPPALGAARRAIEDLVNPNGGGFGGPGGGGPRPAYPGGYPGYGGGGGYPGYPMQGYGGYPGSYPGYPSAGGYPGGYPQAGAGGYGGYGGYGGGQADPYGGSSAYSAGAYGGAGGGGAGASAAAAGAGGASGGSVWQAIQDDQGRTYYYNTQTGQSQWEKPADMP